MYNTSFHIKIFLLFTITLACTERNEDILTEYLATHNSHNVQQSLSYYSDDISFELVGTWIKKGKEEIKNLEEWDAAVNSFLEVNIVRINKDTLFCSGNERNDWFIAVGIDEIVYEEIIFIIKDGLIYKVVAKPSSETGKKIGSAMNSIMEWASKTDNNPLSELLPNGEFTYSKETAEKWLIVLDKWNRYKLKN